MVAPGRSSDVVHFNEEGLAASLHEPVYTMLQDLVLTDFEADFCFTEQGGCGVPASAASVLFHKVPQQFSMLENYSLKRLSEVMFYPVMQAENRVLANWAARAGIFKTFGDVLEGNCIAPADMRRYLMFLGGLSWRARGGGLYPKPEVSGTYYLRWVYTRSAWRKFAQIYGFTYLQSTAIGQAQMQGLRDRWGNWMDLGRATQPINHHAHEGDTASDFYDLGKRGERQVDSIASILRVAGYNPAPLELAGSQMNACYLFSWNRMNEGPYSRWRPWVKTVASGAISWGEFCFGANLAYGFAKSVERSYSCKKKSTYRDTLRSPVRKP